MPVFVTKVSWETNTAQGPKKRCFKALHVPFFKRLVEILDILSVNSHGCGRVSYIYVCKFLLKTSLLSWP